MSNNIQQYIGFDKNDQSHIAQRRYRFDYVENVYKEDEFGKFIKQDLMLDGKVVSYGDFFKLNLICTRLIGVDLSNLDLSNLNFIGADLSFADMTNSIAIGANFIATVFIMLISLMQISLTPFFMAPI